MKIFHFKKLLRSASKTGVKELKLKNSNLKEFVGPIKNALSVLPAALKVSRFFLGFSLGHVSVFMFTLEKSSERLISCIVTDKCRVQEPCGGTAEAAPPPFRPGEPALCGSRPLVTPYYCRLGDFLCYIFISF